MIAIIAMTTACDEQGESIPDQQTTLDPTTVASSPPSPIPDEVLLAELRHLPIYPGSSPGDEVYPEGFAFSGAAGRDFTVIATVEDILEFYRVALGSENWRNEGEPRDETLEPEGAGTQYRRVSWTFIKQDLRLLLGIDPTPKSAAAGAIDYGIGVQPIWYPAFNTSGIPAPSIDTTPIIIGADASD